MLHEHENNQDTETFLKANGKKFTGDCLTAMRLMFSGIRLCGDTCKALYGINDRRLRNCRKARPDMVKSEWILKANGTRSHVEFWIDVFKPPTKSDLQSWFSEYQNEKPTMIIPRAEQLSLSLYETQYR